MGVNVDIDVRCVCGNVLKFKDGNYNLIEIIIICSKCSEKYTFDPKVFPKTNSANLNTRKEDTDMNNDNRPEISKEEYEKPLAKGGDLPPLELLPTRDWLGARIVDVEYRVNMYNGQVQYMTTKDDATGEETQLLDNEGNPRPRKEIYMTFEFHNYTLPNGSPRKAWLQLGATLGDKAHLPTFLYNVLGADYVIDTPKDVVEALKGVEVRLQLKNKPNKDKDKPPSQRVVYDAVERLDAPQTTAPADPIKEKDVEPQKKEVGEGFCACDKENSKPVRTEKGGQIMEICSTCDKVVQAWDE